jgi:hypothetical protein
MGLTLFHYPVHMSITEFLPKTPVGILFVVYALDEPLAPYEAVMPSADELAWCCTLQTPDSSPSNNGGLASNMKIPGINYCACLRESEQCTYQKLGRMHWIP